MASSEPEQRVKFCIEHEEKLHYIKLTRQCIDLAVNPFNFERISGTSSKFLAVFPRANLPNKSLHLTYSLNELKQEMSELCGHTVRTWTLFQLISLPTAHELEAGVQFTPRKGIKGILFGCNNLLCQEDRIRSLCTAHGMNVLFEANKQSCGYHGDSGDTVHEDSRFLVKDLMSGSPVHHVVAEEIQPPSPLHPAFYTRDTNNVFHSLEEIANIVNQCPGDIPGITGLHQLLASCCAASINQVEDLQHPFIVIEGLDGSGKSTLMTKLADHLGAVWLRTPYQKKLHVRALPDGQPSLLIRLFHSVGNYMLVDEIKQVTNYSPAVIDRFWHSTAAYAMATDYGSGGLDSMPPKGHVVYEWPKDLVKPSLVVLLTVSEDVRQRRLQERTATTGHQLTENEKKLERNPLYTQRIIQAYRNISGVPMVEISADGSKDEVLNQVLSAIACVVTKA